MPISHLGELAPYPHPIDVRVFSPGEPLTGPVLLDVVTGEVHEPASKEDGSPGATLIRGVPLKSYPLVAAQRSVVEDLIERT